MVGVVLSQSAMIDDNEDDVTQELIYGKLVVIEKDDVDGPSFVFTGNAIFGR